jgi:hypothetical protein
MVAGIYRKSFMNKKQLISELDDLGEVEADFLGWVCWRDRYDPDVIGYDEVVEIIEYTRGTVDSKRSVEILKTEKLTAEETKDLKKYILDYVANCEGEETSYWVGPYPNEDIQAYVGMYQYEDGSRDIADVFEKYNQAAEFGRKEGFDLVGR